MADEIQMQPNIVRSMVQLSRADLERMQQTAAAYQGVLDAAAQGDPHGYLATSDGLERGYHALALTRQAFARLDTLLAQTELTVQAFE